MRKGDRVGVYLTTKSVPPFSLPTNRYASAGQIDCPLWDYRSPVGRDEDIR